MRLLGVAVTMSSGAVHPRRWAGPRDEAPAAAPTYDSRPSFVGGDTDREAYRGSLVGLGAGPVVELRRHPSDAVGQDGALSSEARPVALDKVWSARRFS
jgi:hypothetical protein